MLKFLRGGRRTAAIWWLVIFGTAVTFVIGFSVAPNLVGTREVRGSTILGTVGGQPITQDEMQTTYTTLAQSFVNQYQHDPQGRDEGMLREQAWMQLLTQKAVAAECQRLDIRASDPEVVFAVRFTPPSSVAQQAAFQTNGRFDQQKYQAALSDPSINWAPLEDEVRRGLPAQKLQERILATAKFSEPELRQAVLDQYQRVQVTVARWAPTTGPVDTTKFTEAALRDYYDKHHELFEGPTQANAVVVQFPKRFTPEDDRAALDRARSLAQQACAGADFSQLARDHSEGPMAEQGGELGRNFLASDLPTPIAAKLATMGDSAVFDPIREGSRYFVIQVRKAPPAPGGEAFYRLRQIVIEIHLSEELQQEDLDRLQKLRKEAKSRPLGPLAASVGVAARETGWFTANSFAPDFFAVPQAQQFALSSPKGALSPIYDADASWMLVQVKDRREAGLRPFDDVRAEVRQAVEREARLAPARQAAERALAAIRAGGDFAASARAQGAASVDATTPFTRNQPVPQLGGSFLAIGVAFGLPVGQVGGPVSSAGSVMLIHKDAVFDPSPASYDSLKTQVSKGLLSTRQNRDFGAWIQWLRDQAKVVDRRGDVLGVD
jgi:peptidyl-prolyl cis-trans isomerase D